MEKVLITGGAGYIGSVLTEILLNNGYQVSVLDNLLYKQTSLSPFCNNKNFNFIYDDVRNESILKKQIVKNDIIIPLAAIVGMPACDKNIQLAEDVNFKQIYFIAKNLSKGQKLIVPNTNSQYGSSDEIVTENSPSKPLSLYAKTKCDAENSVLNSNNGISLRLATVFGVSYRQRLDLLVNDFVYKAMSEKYLVLFESNFMRNYIHVRDVAKAFLHLIKNYEKYNNNAFNVGLTSANMSKKDLAFKIKQFVPDLTIIEENIKKDLDKRNYIVSNEKLEKTGWSCDYSIEDGIKELIMAFPILKNYSDKNFTNL